MRDGIKKFIDAGGILLVIIALLTVITPFVVSRQIKDESKRVVVLASVYLGMNCTVLVFALYFRSEKKRTKQIIDQLNKDYDNLYEQAKFIRLIAERAIDASSESIEEMSSDLKKINKDMVDWSVELNETINTRNKRGRPYGFISPPTGTKENKKISIQEAMPYFIQWELASRNGTFSKLCKDNPWGIIPIPETTVRTWLSKYKKEIDEAIAGKKP